MKLNTKNVNMTSDDGFRFTSNGFKDQLLKDRKELLEEMLFTDVILVSDDFVPIEAHKTILSSASPVFKKLLLMDNNFSKPFLYLKGLKYEHLVLLMQFLYVGETVIDHDDVDEFIKIGKDFEIDSLLSPSENINEKLEVEMEEELSEEEEFELSIDSTGDGSGSVRKERIGDFVTMASDSDIQVEEVSFGEKSDDGDLMISINNETNRKKEFSCLKCDKIFASKRNLDLHIERDHNQVVNTIKCHQCDKVYTNKANQERHMRATHNSIVFKCDVEDCDKSFKYKAGLSDHIKAQHEKKKINCPEEDCGKSFKYDSALNVHYKACHKNKTYTCEKCKWVTYYPHKLKNHYKIAHNLEKYK